MAGPQRTRVLVVEDDERTQCMLRDALGSEGFEVRAVGDQASAREALKQRLPAVALVDVRLEGDHGGLAIARLLRDETDVAVIAVSGATEIHDRLAGFEAGCDDYVTKPFDVDELVARIHAVLRRRSDWSARRWELSDLTVDESAHSVTRAGHDIDLTVLEFDLLTALSRHRGSVVTKEQLLQEVWGYTDYDVNVVEVHISALRRKLEAHGPRLVHTIRGVGYVLRS